MRSRGKPTSNEAWQAFEDSLSTRELETLRGLKTPREIQAFLDSISYSSEQRYRSPLSVLRERKAHCFDGALFAAAALRRLGHPPIILYMIAHNDDDHCLALYKRDGSWGAVAKSNYVGLRLREPVYRTLRELVMSYFEQFYNVNGEKTLRSYTVPLRLQTFDYLNWMVSDRALEVIGQRLDELKIFPLLTRGMIRNLSPVDRRSYQSGLIGSDPAGLHKPEKD